MPVAQIITKEKRIIYYGKTFTRGSTTFIGAGAEDNVRKVARAVNANCFTPPLDVYVFYSSSLKGLPSRWCVGINIPNPDHLIDFLNTQSRFTVADKDSTSWKNSNGETYSVVMPTGILEQTPADDSELKERVGKCLEAIQNATFRQLKTSIIQ